MKTLHLLIAFFIMTLAHSQDTLSKNIVMKSASMSENKEMLHMMRFQGIEYYKVQFKGATLNNKRYNLVAKEFKNGKLTKTDTILNTDVFNYIGKTQGDTLNVTVMASKSDKTHLKLKFMFDRFELNREYKSLKTDDYSLRDFGTHLPITPNKPFYAFAYILPYEDKEGAKYWCAVESSGKDIETWGKEFGIKHYILFEMNFFE